ncbi:MAG: M48 family metalloprotease [Betaproteobacteria bacterium]|nr:M48 family metalloprotease [Betaproteobacteria bacterium]
MHTSLHALRGTLWAMVLASAAGCATKISGDTEANVRFAAITDRLISQAVRYRPETRSWNWSIKLIDEPKTVNAFCLPGGQMGIYSGLIDRLAATDDEIAQVMGHEIAHALANHGAE